MDDPFSGLYGLMRSAGAEAVPDGAARLRLGTVRSVSPLRLDVAGTEQEAERCWICHRLAAQHRERLKVSGAAVTGSLSISASCGNGSHSRMDVLGGTVALDAEAVQDGPVLAPGDEVLLLTTDDQTYYILDKVVRCG